MGFPDRPLRNTPRAFAMILLAAFLIASAWNAVSLVHRDEAHSADISVRMAAGQRPDMDLYRHVHARVADGEAYYAAATDANRAFDFPTKPFVTIRTPVLAWTSAIWGEQGWRIIAILLFVANLAAWFAFADRRFAPRERILASACAGLFGAAAFIPGIAYSHEILAGLLLSLALALSETRVWIAALAMAVLAISIRELALPFLLAWAAIALLAGRRREYVAIAIALILICLGLWLHARGVAAARLPDDARSLGWVDVLGPSLPLYGIHYTTMLQALPTWIAGPLGVLPLLGWLGLGGRTGAFATLWFAGFIAAVAIFARQDNFYWMGLFVPAYGVGLAFVPNAMRDLWDAITVKRSASPMI